MASAGLAFMGEEVELKHIMLDDATAFHSINAARSLMYVHNQPERKQ